MAKSELQAAYEAKQRTMDDLQAECEREMLSANVSREVADKVWALAWDHGHSAGASEVKYHYEDFAEIANLAASQMPGRAGT